MVKNIDLQIHISEEFEGQRLDSALAELVPDYSRERLKSWIKSGQILLNKQVCKPRDIVAGGDQVAIHAEIEQQVDDQPEALPLNILYIDEDIIILNKAVGMVVHPAAGNHQGTLLNALLFHYPELAHLPRAGIIHRLDKDTSGIMVVARNLMAHAHLVESLQERDISRHYVALVYGYMTAGGTVDAPIGRHHLHRKKMAVTDNGKEAVTHYRIRTRYPALTLLDVSLETGRTHQIRVHMQHIGHPIVGDPVYAGRLKLPKNSSPDLQQTLRQFKRQALHAYQLGLIHPGSGEFCQWEAPIPEDMQTLIDLCAKIS